MDGYNSPELANRSPAPYATGVAPLTLISVDIFHRDGALDKSSVRVLVNGASGFDAAGGGFAPAFAGAGAVAYDTVVDGYDGYHVRLKPVWNLANLVTVQAVGQDAYGGSGGGSWSFSIVGATRNFIYYADGYGVHRLHMSDFAGESQDAAAKILSADGIPALGTDDVATLSGQAKDGYMYLLTSMRASGGVLVTRDEVNDPRYYLDGYDAYGAQMSERGIMYVINRTLNRVEVYYGADFRVGGREPDFVYDGSFPDFIDGTLLDLYVASGFSDVRTDSDRLYVASTTGFARVDTYEVETIDGYSAGMDQYGMSWTYGLNGSGKTYEAIGGSASQVVAIHADDAAGVIYAVTDDGQGNGGVTQISLSANRRVLFMNESNGFLPSSHARAIHGKNS